MRKIKKLFILTLSLGLAGPSKAAEPSTPLTWEDCVALAKQSNPELISSFQAAEAANADYQRSFNGFLPNLDFSTSYSRTNLGSAADGRWGAQGRASMNLVNLQETATIKAASASWERAKANFAVTSSEVRFNLRRAFADLLFFQEQVDVSKRIVDLRKRNAEMVTLKYDSGRESKGNMLQSKAELKEAEANLAEALRNVRVGQRALNNQIGRDHFKPVAVAGTWATEPVVAHMDVEPLAELNPKVTAQIAAQTIAEANVKEAKSSLWPTLSANYARSFTDDHFFPGNPGWSASGVLAYPLFGSGLTSTYFAVTSAKRSYEKALADLRSVRNEVRESLETTWANFARTVDQVSVQATFLQAAVQRNEEANVRYSSGLMSFEDWEKVVSDLVNFERSRLGVSRDAVTAEAAWDQARGKLLEEQ